LAIIFDFFACRGVEIFASTAAFVAYNAFGAETLAGFGSTMGKAKTEAAIKRQRILITGRVQGVGCRPFVYRLAGLLGLTGRVWNDTTGVTIEVQGSAQRIESFVECLRTGHGPIEKPAMLKIATCRSTGIDSVPEEREFAIVASDAEGPAISQVTPDTATCGDCLREMNERSDFRYRYPFINCTNCGPRYSIVRTIPYDRPNTTMAGFEMCPACRAQYTETGDRRFHAQPVACPACGPAVQLTDNTGRALESDSQKAIAQTAEMLRQGRIVAIKGVGGFHLAVDAFNDDAVACLRERKQRDYKPFAMMAASIEIVRRYVRVDETAEGLLRSPQSPIVLLDRNEDAGDWSAIAPSVAQGTATLGFMLCYAPLHYLLFAAEGIEVLVMTSANMSDEPLICDNDQALARLGSVADAFLNHNRDIYRQVDDSVVHIVDGRAAMLRRSRGYVPTPILMSQPCSADVFAAGADLKNTFCFVKGNQLILSEHIGDLADATVYRHYTDSVRRLQGLFEVAPTVAACDLHPGYLSTQYARLLGAERVIAVQHHWAHIASVLAEYDYPDRVIGIVADGTGYGADDAIWGCECLIASLAGFERIGRLMYYPLPGGDKAAKEPIRPILGLLKMLSGSNSYLRQYADILGRIEPDATRLDLIAQQLDKNINTVKTSSLGRLFDAAACLAGLGDYNHFEAQLPMALESVADESVKDRYTSVIKADSHGTLLLDVRNMLKELIADIRMGVSAAVISAKFHNCLAQAMLDFALGARQKYQLSTVALSGGVFCNRYLANRLITMLKKNDFSVLFKQRAPANDGGIALGQAAIAAKAVQSGRV